jgi:archaemetzincin
MRRRDLLLGLLGAGLGCRDTPDQAANGSPAEAGSAPEPAPPPRVEDPWGSLADVPAELHPAFDPAVHAPAPTWLATEDEPAQSFATYLDELPPRPSAGRRTLAILPIGEYPRGFVVEYERVRLVRSPEPALLGRFCEAWFGLPVRILPAMSDELLERMPARERDGRRQLDASALLAWLQTQLPDDCFCVLALTLDDLFESGAAWLFGLASIHERVGIHSMLRYDPGFANTDDRPPGWERMILARALRVVAHETAHMLGMRHCVHFACVMNPTAGLDDLDRLPLHLCPVCLRKLGYATQVPLAERWLALAELTRGVGLDADGDWFNARAQALGQPRRSTP